MTQGGELLSVPVRLACLVGAGLCLCACGRLNYGQSGPTELDGSADATVDSGLMTPLDASTDTSLDAGGDTGAPPACVRGPFSELTRLPGPSASEANTGVSITADGLLLVYMQPDVDESVLLQSTRASVSEAFSPPTTLLGLCVNWACEPSLSPDGLGIYFGNGLGEIAYASRSSRDLPFGPGTPILGAQSLFLDPRSPAISADETDLYFQASAVGREDADLFVAHRDTASGLFTRFEALAAINTPDANEAFPGVSLDGLELFFEYAPGTSGADIWVARRADVTSPFGPPEFVPELNALDGNDGDPVFALDDQMIVITSNNATTAGYQLFTATRRCL